MDVKQFVGCAEQQTEDFVEGIVRPVLAANPHDGSTAAAIRV